MSKPLPDNVFYDINKLPADWGILLFPLSHLKLNNTQDPNHCLEYVLSFSPEKVSAPKIGCVFAYTDFLYLHSQESASDLHYTLSRTMLNHKQGLWSRIKKNWQELQIQEAFSFTSWFQIYLSTDNLMQRFDDLKTIYQNDQKFQELLALDCRDFNREVSENQVNFFLEEHLVTYFLSYGVTKLQNEFVMGREKWLLNCYPGKPPRHLVYLHQLNPFKLESTNPYKNSWYNLADNKLYEFDRIDLDTYGL